MWYWQTCTEFGWYQTSNQPSEVWGDENISPLEISEQYCRDAYGDVYSHDYLEELMEATNDFYGSTEPDVTRVAFVHGSVDPWHPMGIYEEDLNDESPAIYIEGASHCADMYDDYVANTPQMQAAREEIKSLVAEWCANP